MNVRQKWNVAEICRQTEHVSVNIHRAAAGGGYGHCPDICKVFGSQYGRIDRIEEGLCGRLDNRARSPMHYLFIFCYIRIWFCMIFYFYLCVLHWLCTATLHRFSPKVFVLLVDFVSFVLLLISCVHGGITVMQWVFCDILPQCIYSLMCDKVHRQFALFSLSELDTTSLMLLATHK